MLTFPPTTASTNTGSATFTLTSNEPLVGVTAETHVANPGGADLTRACTCTATSCTCDFLAAHTNAVHARARDACGNPSAPTGAPADSVGTLTAPFGSNEGHVILIGHDYLNTGKTPVVNILVDATRLAPYVLQRDHRSHPRPGRHQ